MSGGGGPIARGAYRALLEEHGVEQLDEQASKETSNASKETSNASEPTSAPARFGTRHVDESGRRALEVTAEEPAATVRAWASSPANAIRAWALTRDHGASLRSTCDPDRAHRVQTSTDPSLGGREHDAIERVRNVSRALDRAEAEPLEISRACPLVTPRQARAIVLLKIAGEARIDRVAVRGVKRKGTYARRDPLTASAVVLLVREHLGLQVSERHVLDLCSHVLDRVRRDLEASGELRARAPRGPRPLRGFAADVVRRRGGNDDGRR